jgi:hypothetical protein
VSVSWYDLDKLWSRLLAGVLTGLLTGLLVSLFAQLFYVVELEPGSNSANQLPDGSEGRVFSGVEALVTFALLPIVVAWLTTVGLRDRRLFLRLVVVAYLTVVIPLIGLGIGGPPELFHSVLVQTVGGAIGGGGWSLLVLSLPLRSK